MVRLSFLTGERMKLSKLQEAQELIICMIKQDWIPKKVRDNWENPMFPVGYGLNKSKEKIWFLEEASKIAGRSLLTGGRK